MTFIPNIFKAIADKIIRREAESAMAAMEKEVRIATTIFDPSGDRKIVAGSGPTEMFIVSSKAMSTACKPWNSMLGHEGCFVEATDSFTDPIMFPDDNVDALRILLAAAHSVHNSIPATLEYGQLLKVAVLCDKYDATGLVEPWVSGWIRQIRSSTSFTEEKAGWLHIAWTFGSTEIFTRIAYKMALEMEVHAEGNHFLWCARIEEDDVPSDVLGELIQLLERLQLQFTGW